jgi:hypothetical protein
MGLTFLLNGISLIDDKRFVEAIDDGTPSKEDLLRDDFVVASYQ